MNDANFNYSDLSISSDSSHDLGGETPKLSNSDEDSKRIHLEFDKLYGELESGFDSLSKRWESEN